MTTVLPEVRYDLLVRPAHDQNHFVLFYEDERSLHGSVVKFLGSGLLAGEPMILIATAEHIQSFRAILESNGFDVTTALETGLLRVLDAEETLSSIMTEGGPDAERFFEVMGGLLAELRAAFPSGDVRVYGEMVDLLCRGGMGDAAIRLEELWNELAKKHSFSLFCAYVMDHFSSEKAQLYAKLCNLHTHAIPAIAPSGTHERLRTIADLQQRTLALEGEIERSKQSDMFRLLVESVKDYAIFVLDPRGYVQTWNAGAQRIKGYSANEIVGQHFSRFYPKEDVDAGKCAMELEGAARDGRFEDEGWRVRKDGTQFWANVIITALFDPSGQLLGFAKVTRDLTERKKAEEEREKAAQERAEHVKVQELNRTKDQFLATISHELRTPLNAISGWASLLKGAVDLSDVKKAADSIARNTEAQIRIVDDMLDLSRIITGKMRIDVRTVDLSQIVRDAVEVVRAAADAKDIRLRVTGTDQPMTLIGDPVCLQQTVWNFLSNAVKFSGAKGTVHTSLKKEGSMVELEVSDDGRGIERAFLPYVFEPFRQADSSTTRRVGGLGLGLAIVKHIAELHGGTVSVSSEGPGEGATFAAQFPIRAVAPPPPQEDARKGPAPAPDRQREKLPLSGVRVLVVDDAQDAREILNLLFRSRGALVSTAGSAAEARQALASFDPHVIVSDIGMPDEDGLQLMQSIRNLPMELGGMTPAIALTAYAYGEDRRRALEAGFNYHLAKPVHHDELLSAVHNLVSFAGKHRGVSQG